ncbi:hypothetical protein ACWD7C_10580 [Streptomyces sp. NPDC005134]|uniref:hypothetical protein n=1 Tax=Streptomyces sp. NPDC005098 TaxID=3154560 RepID=UPI0033A252B8
MEVVRHGVGQGLRRFLDHHHGFRIDMAVRHPAAPGARGCGGGLRTGPGREQAGAGIWRS